MASITAQRHTDRGVDNAPGLLRHKAEGWHGWAEFMAAKRRPKGLA